MKANWPRIAHVILAGTIVVASVAAWARRTNPQPSADSADAERIHRVETNLASITLGASEPPLELNLLKLMELYKVPAVSVGVIDNYKIAWAKAYGVTEAGVRRRSQLTLCFRLVRSANP
jgi:CubicO group peptidase (beta-lactamase class C family)